MPNKELTFWTLLEQYYVEIPIIQRDYVQGRKTESRVRDSFLSAIYKALKEDRNLHLDFIYGVTKQDKFIPLDGQQRLTTLFLLHYYLALKKNQFNYFNQFQVLLLDEKKFSKFSYEIRESSKEFCNLLVKSELGLDKPLSETIKDQNWFFSKWEQDPTIASMLIMLDTIQATFREDNLFENLKKNITFSFLEPEKLNIKNSDELYIKMNSRGKQLNEFENFKAYVVGFLDEDKRTKFDNSWFDIFWNTYKKELQGKKGSEQERFIEENIFGGYLNFFKNITPLFNLDVDDDILKFNYTGYVVDVEKILDALCTYEDNMVYRLRDKEIFNINIFQDFVQSPDKITYSEKARFYVLMKFFVKVGKVQGNEELFYQWMRVSLNIINNTIDSVENLKRLIKLFDDLSDTLIDKEKTFYELLASSDLSATKQFKEEKKKAPLIKKTNWKKEISLAESHWYLDGQIGFLLEFSDNDLDKFVEYRDKFFHLFNKDKIGNKESKYQTLIHRALLTFGDYLPHKNKNSSRYTFCYYRTDLQEKNENWRKVFNQKYFQDLLDDSRALREIIDNFSFDCKDWRSWFINPNKDWEIISYAKYYKIEKDNNKVYLNQGGVQGWGWRRVGELYGYYLFKEVFEKKKITGFSEKCYWNNSSPDEDKPCIIMRGLGNYQIEIYGKKDKFHIDFSDRYNKNLPQTIIDILENNNFKIKDENWWYKRKIDLCNRKDIVNIIEKLCEELDILGEN